MCQQRHHSLGGCIVAIQPYWHGRFCCCCCGDGEGVNQSTSLVVLLYVWIGVVAKLQILVILSNDPCNLGCKLT
jgi:hypothetical protein